MPSPSSRHPPPPAAAQRLVAWFDRCGRSLPWREPGTSPWAVLVSEIMLQQTPVTRVEPAYLDWISRWPTPAELAAEEPGEAIRMWGRLGYPRRALRLHQTARILVADHGGAVPEDLDTLLTLPGVGDYTARAVLAFGFGRRAAAVDVNVRRVLARVIGGEPDGGPATTAADRARAEQLLPDSDGAAARTAAALMELGALVCVSGTPSCSRCPVATNCRWLARGAPSEGVRPRRAQGYAGTDRQVRGRLLAAVRESAHPVPAEVLAGLWHDPQQRDRSLASLLADGLLVRGSENTYSLPRQ